MNEIIKYFLRTHISGYNKYKLIGLMFLSSFYYIFETFGLIFVFRYFMILTKKNIKNFLIILLSFFILFPIINYTKNKLELNIQTENLSSNIIYYINSLYDYIGENFKNIKIGSTITRIFMITSQWNEVFIIFFNIVFPIFIILLTLCCIMFYININYGLILLLCLIVTTIIIYFMSNNIIKSTIIQNEVYYNNYDKINNQLNNLLNTLINNEQKKEQNINYFNWTNYKGKDIKNKSYIINLKLYLIINMSIFIVLLIYFILKENNFDISKLENKTLLILTILYFTSTYLKISFSIGDFLKYIGKCKNSIPFLKKITLKNNNKNNNKNIKSLKKYDIKIKNLIFGYNNHLILKNINLNINHNSKTAIIGRSGYGKSTICKLLLKLHKYIGNIYINNIDIQHINTNYLRSKIIYINQRTNMIDTNILDNMNYGNNIDEKKIIQLLNKYDLEIIFSGLKKGIYQNVDFDGSNLSLGMQKIIILIRGILKVKNGNIIIFDEPLAGLDSKTRQKIIKLIINETKNKTVIVVTHDKEILPYMDKVINIEKINNK
jgi:ABC-type multidrug transport system fused ATPase/permease subunit